MHPVFGILAFAIAAWLTYLFSRPGSRLYILDHPNERSLHSRPTPRTGGIGILAAVFLVGLGSAFYYGFARSELLWLAGAGLLVAAASFLDDRFGLWPPYRLAAHLAAAVLVVYGAFRLPALTLLPGWALAGSQVLVDLFLVLFVVWMINLYNFMDGMDGFAGGMAVFGFGAFAVLGAWASHEAFGALSLIPSAAAGGFLLFNFPPARIFMGDVGSTTLGLLAASLMLWAQRDGVFPLWVGVLVFSPFIVDATVTLIRRILQGERFWQAHKTHYYQRLVQLGWGHRKTVLWEYALMAASAAAALWVVGRETRAQVLVFVLWVLVYAAGILAVRRLETRIPGGRRERQD